MVRIINYIDEGDKIISDLSIESVCVKLIEDSTRDAFGGNYNQRIKEYNVLDIYKTNTTNYIRYDVKTEKGDELFLYFHLLIDNKLDII